MDPTASLLHSCYHKRSVAEVCLKCPHRACTSPANGCAEYRRACREASRPTGKAARVQREARHAD